MAMDKTGGLKESVLVMENFDIFTNFLTDRTTQFGIEPIMNVSKSGTGAVNVAPINISGEDIWSADLVDSIKILFQSHLLSLDQVQPFSGWFMENKTFTFSTLTNMIIKPINPNKTENLACVIIKRFG